MPAPPEHDDRATVDLPLQTRADVRLMPETADVERRTVELVWSTGAAVRRRDPWTGKRYDEVLSLEEAHVDLSRLNGGAPLLNTHGAWDLSDVIGVVERAWIAREGEALVGRATVRFSDRADVEPIWRDVAAGIIRNVSVGYSVRTYEITEAEGQSTGLARRRLAAARALRRAGRRRCRRRLPRRRAEPRDQPNPSPHPCHLLRRAPAPIPEESPMIRETETETTPPEAAATAAPAPTAPAEPTPAAEVRTAHRGAADPRGPAGGRRGAGPGPQRGGGAGCG